MDFSEVTKLSHSSTTSVTSPASVYATGQSKCVSPHTINYDDITGVTHGFGYDPVYEDFKIVRVVTYLYKFKVEEDVNLVEEVGAEVRVEVEVHSALNGVLCCISEGFSGVMAFDLNNEVFNCDVEFPVLPEFARIIGIDDSAVGFITSKGFGREIKLWKLDDVKCLRGAGEHLGLRC
ncbi:hypothetical protein POM88_012489 [Heracleum sosnowskyi]|uniref:Uncharacterized protein n=1 Tax=Heracleum sosnowskyi TaxID=360622 RepID=A0AAD8IYS6_9APIA|nr:hypothetical protein POM88_012489 [Heracleum sosnowskyi]